MQTASQEDDFILHTVTSTSQQRTSFAKFRKRRPQKLNYDRYLTGRSYQLFKSGINAAATLTGYRKCLYYFCDYLKMTTEDIVTKYGPYIQVRGRKVPNIEGQLQLQEHIQNYVLFLRDRVSSNEITAASCIIRIPPVKLFFEMNNIVLNWKIISKMLPVSDFNAKDEAYTREQIQKILSYCDLRTKVIVLFLASGGFRLGALPTLTDGCIKPMYDEKGKLLAAHVIAYKETSDEYDAFVTPEAYKAYQAYRELRIKYGESITEETPVILKRFDVRKINSGIKQEPVSESTVSSLISVVVSKAGVRQESKHYNQMYNIKTVHGFRKFFSTTLSSIKSKDGRRAIDNIERLWMEGHSLRGRKEAMDENYNRADLPKLLLEQYVRAVPELTISDEERLQVHVQKLETDISSYKTVELALAEKDEEIKELKKRQEDEMKRFREEIKKEIANQVQTIWRKVDTNKLS